jgi:TonB-dependent SusC/RagA subfamily outer membrane receptor
MTTLTLAVAQGAPLLAAWVVTALAVTALFTIMAVLLHRLARGTIPNRWVWGTALMAAFAFTVTQPWRRATAPLALPLPAATVTAPAAAPPPPSVWDIAGATISGAARIAEELLTTATTTTAAAVRPLPLAAKLFLVLLWPVMSVTLLAIGGWSYRRQRTVLRGATRVEAHGYTLHVSEGTGPAVYGVLRPRIVMPAWLMQRTDDEQRLVVAHEASHITAGDPALLLTACVLTALMPWNPGAWYMLARLRLAIELDCDARVLQAGTTPRRYGALLIDLSATATPAPLLTGAAAFSHHASHLERRLRFMTDRPATYITARRLASLSLGTLAIVAACGAELPTSAELEGMDVAAAERRAFVVAPSLTAAGYEVDGKRVTEKEAKALAAERIASIEIVKQDRTRSLVRIATLPKATAAAPSATSDSGAKQILAVVRDDGAKQILVAVRADGTGDSTRTVVLVADSIRPLPARRAFDGLVILDGVPTTEDVMRKLPPNQIERIEVIKGAAGEKLYGPQGARGVIVITTKK